MAKRPVFTPGSVREGLVREVELDFTWHAGFSLQQKQRSIGSLHQAAGDAGIAPVLEISSKSEQELGRALSAFELILQASSGKHLCVEVAFQGSKVFEQGGPYLDLLEGTGQAARKDERIRGSGRMVAFEWEGDRYPLEPKTVFYDWLYLCALKQNPDLARGLAKYGGFTDIEFNPKRSINCQAKSAALWVGLVGRNIESRALENFGSFLATIDKKQGQGLLL